MGKNKTASTQRIRTKGNLKPSNSDRSSEFLQRNGGASNFFLNLNVTTDSAVLAAEASVVPASMPSFSSSLLPMDNDVVAATLDHDFLTVLRRLEKRNCTTKQKALDLFISLLKEECGKSEQTILASVLPFWPRLFNYLSFDDDRRVRELSQIAMHELAKRIGRKLMLILKDVVVSWTFSAVDAYENTAKAAQVGINSTFPGTKRGDLCRMLACTLLDESYRRLEMIRELPLQLKSCKKERHTDDPLPPESHQHLNATVQFIIWLNSILPDLVQLQDAVSLARLRRLISVAPCGLWSAITPVLRFNFGPLTAAYHRLLQTVCEYVVKSKLWKKEEEEEKERAKDEEEALFSFLVSSTVKELQASPEHLSASLACLSAFDGKRVWKELDWKDTVSTVLIPLIDRLQTKTHRQAVYSSLLQLVSHLPLTLNDEEAISTTVPLLVSLLEACLRGLYRSLNMLPPTSHIMGVEGNGLMSTPQMPINDQGSSIHCLTGLFELTRYLVDLVAREEPCQELSKPHPLLHFLLSQVVFPLVGFALRWEGEEGSSTRRWVNKEQFFHAIFDQTSKMLTHLARSERPSMIAIFTLIVDEITSMISTLTTSSSLVPSAQPAQILIFLDNLGHTVKTTNSHFDDWCYTWFLNLFKILKPVDDAGDDGTETGARWLLAISLLGYVEGDLGMDPYSLLLDSVIPATNLKWSKSMTLGMTRCWHAHPKASSWVKATQAVRTSFLAGPISGLIHACNIKTLPVLEAFSAIVTSESPLSSDSCIHFFNILFSCDNNRVQLMQRNFLDAVIKQADYSLLSAVVFGLISYNKPVFPPVISKLIELTLDILWSSENTQKLLGEAVVVYLSKLPEEDRITQVCDGIWSRVLQRLAEKGIPFDSSLLLDFSSRCLSKEGRERFAHIWASTIIPIFTSLCQVVSDHPVFYPASPRCVQAENGLYPIDLLQDNRLNCLLVALQIGFRLNLHTELVAKEKRQIACLIIVLRVWMMGTWEPFLMMDISNDACNLVLPDAEKDAASSQSNNNIIAVVNCMYSELTSKYTLSTWVSLLSNHPFNDSASSALLAALSANVAGQLQARHPMDWPLDILRPASCTNKSVETSWLDTYLLPAQLGGSATADSFLQLCEVALPSGLLRRCLPREEILAHLLTLSSTPAYLENFETLSRILEVISALSSVKFVGEAYSCTLAPFVFNDGIRDALIVLEETSSPELVRATLAAMKSLQVYVLLRQSWTPLNLLNPRLTRSQWDALLCLTASWTTLVLGPNQSEALRYRAFALVAAVGALFVNSQCPTQIVCGSLVKKESSGNDTSVTQLMEAKGEEWEDDLDASFDYSDCEDDGTVPERDLTDLPEDDKDNEVEDQRNVEGARRLAPPALIQKDWHDFFSGNLYGSLFPLAIDLCLPSDQAACKDTPPYISSLCAAVSTCPIEHIFQILKQQPEIVANHLLFHDLPPSQTVVAVDSPLGPSHCILAPHTRNSLNLCLRLIASAPHQAGQLLGHVLLTRLASSRSLEPVRRMADIFIPHIPFRWTALLTAPLPDCLELKLKDVDVAVTQFARGSIAFSINQIGIEGHRQLLAYLLAWDAVVSLLSGATQQGRASLQTALLEDVWIGELCRLLLTLGLLLPMPCNISNLLTTACRLQPDDRLLLTSVSRQSLSSRSAARSAYAKVENPIKVKDDATWFDAFAPPDRLTHLPGHRHPGDLSHLAVHLLHRLLSESPALIRSIYSSLLRGGEHSVGILMTPGQARQLAGHLERIVRKYFSESLIANEVVSLERRADLFKMKLGATYDELPEAGCVDIKGRPLSREVVTVYHFSADQSLEMVIKLPENFPLAPVTVEAGHKVGAPTHNWRSWIIHLSVFINNQNGSILDGIGLWLTNLKKKFDGVEDCAICYSVIHDRNFSFPRMQCRVCKKRFHNECMYRYFQTSRNPTCPLCRSLFYAAN